MPTGLLLRVSIGNETSEMAFPRLPVMIGRDATTAQCVLADKRVSDLHACIDVLDGKIGVRDIGTANGTFIAGRRLPPNCWIRPAAVGEPVLLTIGDHAIRVSTFEAEGDSASSSLAELAMSTIGHTASPSAGMARQAATSTAEDAPPPTFRMQAVVFKLTAESRAALAAMDTFRANLARELEAAPPTARPLICATLIRDNPQLADEVRLRTILEGDERSPQIAPRPLAEAALGAMQELVSWYLGQGRQITTPGEIASFKDAVRGTLDELFLGYPAVLESMRHFEQQVAIPAASGPSLPALSPAQFAAMLLDWRSDSKTVRGRLRASFAELKMHHAAVLNGIMGGVTALLRELSPAEIERSAAVARQAFVLADPWELYKRRYGELADGGNPRFRALFGQAFVELYRQLTSEGDRKT
jgi:predicted component of type VI protein secretion system